MQDEFRKGGLLQWKKQNANAAHVLVCRSANVDAHANATSKEGDMDTKIIGTRIAEGRKNKGLSQAQFAELVSVTPQAVGKWERSESLPDIFMLGKIGEVIGITNINFFLGKKPCSCNFCDCCKEG